MGLRVLAANGLKFVSINKKRLRFFLRVRRYLFKGVG
jgi:hypothetical protein